MDKSTKHLPRESLGDSYNSVETLPHKTLVQLSKARGTVQSEVKARPVKS